MLDRVAAYVTRHDMFAPGARVGVAVSGGADSVCLLHALRELAPHWNLHLSVVHIEHGIRGEASKADAAFVATLAADFGLALQARTADLPEMTKQSRENLEQAARDVRNSFFSELIGSGAVNCIATGHTRDDQAETVLFRLLRGSGTTGLTGIHPITRSGIVRPLLGVTRAEIEEYLRSRNICWRDDETNRDLSYDRNRIRHSLLPLLREQYNPRIGEILVRTAVLAHEDEAYWDAAIATPQVRDSRLFLRADDLAGMLPAVGRRLIRKAIAAVRGDLRQVGFEHVDAILRMAAAPEGSARFRFAGVDVWRSFDLIRFAEIASLREGRPAYEERVPVPGEIDVRAEKLRLQFNLQAAGGPSCATVEDVLDWDRTLALIDRSGHALILRNWRPGDRYCPQTGGERKIKQMFQDERVPVWERSAWPVLSVGEQIVWSRRFGPANVVAPDEQTSTLLVIDDDYIAPA